MRSVNRVVVSLCFLTLLSAHAFSQTGPTCTLTVAPTSGVAPLMVNANGSCTPASGTIASYSLNFGDGTPALTTPSGSHTYTKSGGYTVTLTGIDQAGAKGSFSVGVTATNPVVCTVGTTPRAGVAPLAVSASGGCTSNAAITSYSLNFGVGSPVTSNTGSTTYTQPGRYNVTLTGTDANSNTGTASQVVNVTNPVSCIFNVTPDAGFSPLTVNANGSCTSRTGTINSGNITINWGDGTPLTPGSSGSHVYSPATPPTPFSPQIQATDSNVINGSAGQTIWVAGASAASCTLAVSPGSGQFPLNVTANLSCTPPVGVAFSSGTIDWRDNTTPTTVTGPTFTASHTYLRNGTFGALASVTFGTTTVSADQNVFVSAPTPTTPAIGDVYISTGMRLVERYSATGTLAQLFQTNNGNQLGQMSFDTSRNLYVASFGGGDGSPNALEFDPAGNESFFVIALNLFSTNSFAFDKAGNAYQGGSGGPVIQQFDANGQFRKSFTVALDTTQTGSREVDYLDLAADQCTIYYTSRGTQIKGFNICTNQQLATDFADNIGSPVPPSGPPVSFANELRIRPNREILLADSDFVIRFAANGTVMQKYSTPAGKNTFTGLSLDPDETSFWTSQGTGELDHFDIATGNLLSSFQTSFGIGEAVAVLGEIRAATNQGPTCTLSVVPNTGVNPLAVTATGNCTDPTAIITSTTLDFGDGTTQSATSGPHTYTSPGTFTVKLSATDANGPFTSVTQTVTVAVNQPPTCTLAVAPTTGVAPLNVAATGNCTDPDGDALSTTLDFGDGTTQTATSGTHSYTKAGVFTVTVTATDVVGQKATVTQTVSVGSSLAPTCTLTVTPASGQTPLAVTATGNCTGTNAISTTVLDFGDGTTANASSGTHTYSQAGTFTVKLTATDAFGLTGSATQTVVASSNNFPQGVFIGVGGGRVMQFTPGGTVLKTLDTTLGGTIADMGFDKAGNLYTVDFTAANVSKFNLTTGALQGTFGSGYDCQPETMVFDGAGNVYVGQQGCALTILKFDPNGNFLGSYQVATENEGSDDLALSADQCTMLYTSEGPSILRYDVCQKKQLTPFATGLNKALQLKVLPDGGVLVADLTDIIRFNSSGQRVTTYTVPNQNCLYGIALDQDGTTFWTDDYCSSNIDHIDINSGKVLSTFNTGTASGTVFGLAIAGSGLNVAGVGNGGKLTASPQSATLGAGQSATFTVSFVPNAAAAGRTLVLSCAGLPPGLTCSFNPPTITLGAAGTTSTSTLTITRTMTAALLHPSSPWMLATWMGVVPAIVLMGFRSPRRRRSSMLCLALIVATTGVWASCGGGGSSPMTTPTTTTPPGAYTIIVVGNASGVQASTTVNVTAQ